MVDSVDEAKRSSIMARVRAKDTKPELAVRRLIYASGYRYRLHSKKLPGKPDMVFAGRHKVIFVHGCFWHRHPGCANCRIPKSRVEFWENKLNGNRQRDLRTQAELERLGWKVLVVWECELKDPDTIIKRISEFLNCKD